VDRFLADVRYAFRLLRKTPIFTAVAITTLALGTGVNTAVFSVVDSTVIQRLPYADAERVVMVWEDGSFYGFPKNTPAPANYRDWRRLNRSFADMAATRGTIGNVTGDGVPEQLNGRAVTANFFPLLGVTPTVGRTFTDAEDTAGAPVIVISFGLWQRRFGGEASIVGQTIVLNDARYEIVGVMPRPFVFRNREVDYWIPMHFSPAQAAERGSHYLNVVARLKPGVSVDAASADMGAIAKALQQQFPNENRHVGAVVVPMKEDVLGSQRLELLVLMGAAVTILLVACANLAGLLLSRAVARRGEVAVRLALGASRGRVMRQVVIEALAISIPAGIAGLAIAPWGVTLMSRLVPAGVTASDVALNSRLLAFSVGVSIVTGLLFSIIPALQSVRGPILGTLQQFARAAGAGRGRIARDVLVILQVAAALVLLVAAGLMLRTLANLRAVDVGFRSDHLLTLRTPLRSQRYKEPPARHDFYDRVLARVNALPGVERSAYAVMLPFLSAGFTTGFMVVGEPRLPDHSYDALYRVATNDYLQTLGVTLIEGRLFDARDDASAPRVVVINDTLAREFFPHGSALGRRMTIASPNDPPRTIVGVVRDVRERGYELAMKPGVYLPAAQQPPAVPENLIVRTSGDPLALARDVRAIIADVDPDQPVSLIRTMDTITDIDVADRHQQMMLLGAFAALALLLATLGLYGVLAYAVSQRTREIGLRIALGATPRAVVLMIVTAGVRVTAIGLVIGLVASWGLTRTMRSLLFGVAATDTVTSGSVVMLLTVVSLAACLVPALRAMRVEPSVVLRE
jgi:predicted permease